MGETSGLVGSDGITRARGEPQTYSWTIGERKSPQLTDLNPVAPLRILTTHLPGSVTVVSNRSVARSQPWIRSPSTSPSTPGYSTSGVPHIALPARDNSSWSGNGSSSLRGTNPTFAREEPCARGCDVSQSHLLVCWWPEELRCGQP